VLLAACILDSVQYLCSLDTLACAHKVRTIPLHDFDYIVCIRRDYSADQTPNQIVKEQNSWTEWVHNFGYTAVRTRPEFVPVAGMGTRFSGSTGTGDPKNPGGFFRFNRKISGLFRLKSAGFPRLNREFCGRFRLKSSAFSRFNRKICGRFRADGPVFSG